MDGFIDAFTNEWVVGWIHRYMDEWMDGCIDIPVVVAVIAVHAAGTNDPSESANTIYTTKNSKIINS